MREGVVKKVCIFLTILLVILLGIFGIKYKRQKAEKAKKIEKAEQEIYLLQQKKSKKQEELEEINEKYEKKINGKTCMIVSLEQMNQELYTDVYPLFRRYDMVGVFVMKDGKIPGDEGVLTQEQYDIMLENGWEAAMGTSEAISLKDADYDRVLEWEQYVKDYLEALENAGLKQPVTYCFEAGEYKQEYEEFLNECGFKIIRHYGENGLSIVTKELSEPIVRVGAVEIAYLTSSNKTTLTGAAYTQDSIAISTEYVITQASDGSQTNNLSNITDLLLALVDYRANYSVKIKTFKGFRSYKKKLEKKAEKNEEKRDSELKEVQDEIDEIDAQIQAIMKS